MRKALISSTFRTLVGSRITLRPHYRWASTRAASASEISVGERRVEEPYTPQKPSGLISSVEKFILFAPTEKQSSAQSFIHRRLSESRYRQIPSRHVIFENLISLLIYHRRFREAVTVYQRMRKEGFPSSQQTNANMIAIGIANQSITTGQAIDALERIFMDKNGFSEDDFVLFLSVLKDLELPPHSQVHLIRRFIHRRGAEYTPPRKIVNLLAGILAKDGKISEALDVIARYESKDTSDVHTTAEEIEPENTDILRSHSYVAILTSLDTLDPLSSDTAVDRILTTLRQSSIAFDNSLFTALITHYATKRDVRKTAKLYGALVQAKEYGIVSPSLGVYRALFKLMARRFSIHERERRLLRPRHVFADMYRYALSTSTTRTADEQHPAEVPSTLNLALNAFISRRDYAGAVVVLETFITMGIPVHRKTYSIVVKHLLDRVRRDGGVWGERLFGFGRQNQRTTEPEEQRRIEALLRFSQIPGLVPTPGARRTRGHVPTAAIINGTASIPPGVMLSVRVLQRMVKRAMLARLEEVEARLLTEALAEQEGVVAAELKAEAGLSEKTSMIAKLISDVKQVMLPAPSESEGSSGT
uniref:Pentatricopeptide repeat protein n=1 Tax=Moniliophthora roreri TaxID=221103 RepID=A0A0W0G9M8_MONRR